MEKLFDWIINHDELSIVCCPSFRVVNTIKKLGIVVDNINYDINYKDMPSVICNDFVFDDVRLRECVLHYNCEKTYPVGRMHEGVFILRGDDKEHNGDCNPTFSIDQLVEDNKLTEVFDHYQKSSKNRKYTHYYVYGTNY
tara:strand:+ start:15128 stop:15547 length:420 start_codon:yes stop_codon:yes gene_type:complete